MKLVVVIVTCFAGSAVSYNTNREPLAQWSNNFNPYQQYQPDPYAVDVSSNLLQEQSQKLFWDKFGNNYQGSNQVGGSGLWNHFANKFPFLNNMFGRMETPTLYGPPEVYSRPQYFYAVQPYYPQGVQVTDDAVVVSAPGVPPFAPSPVAPAPAPGGYNYARPQYRLELPQKTNLK